MAKKSKSRQSKDSAEEIVDTPSQDDVAQEDAPAKVEEPTPDTAETVEDAPQEPAPADEPPVEDDPVEELDDAEPAPEHEMTEPKKETSRPAAEHHDGASNSVLLPAILGGLIAAGLGFGAAYYIIPRADPNLNESVAENSAALESLRADVAATAEATPDAVDLSPVSAEIAAVRDELTSEVGSLTDQLAAFDARLTELEKQPSSDGTLQDTALQAYQRELDDLRSQVEEQAGAAMAQLESTRAEAAAIEQAALDAAEASQIRAALAQIQTALSTGAPMQTALTDLEDAMGEPVPSALSEVAEGAPTLAKLQADFPNAARAALADARAGGESGEETNAFGSFLREQLNVRSVAPRDGDDADAILSRAQAAVSEGQLQTALDEIAGLPDVAKAALSEWVAVAETRVSAVQAADDISLSLNVN